MCLLLAACGATLPRVSPELLDEARRHDPAATGTELQVGRDLYVQRCGSCHSLADPRAYQDEEWRTWIGRMGPKAHITAAQEQHLFAYLRAARQAEAR